MKLVTFEDTDKRRAPGVVRAEDGTVVDLSCDFPDLVTLIRAGEAGLAAARRIDAAAGIVHPLEDVRLLAPLPVPESIRDCSVFKEHLLSSSKVMARLGGAPLEIPEVWYQQPVYYKGNRFSVIGTGAEIVWPPTCARLDYELEIAIVIGKRGRDSPIERAHEHIFGFMIFNDISARDFQMLDMQGLLGPAKGKDFDTGNVMGPWLVTRDEIADPYALDMVARLNGKTIGGGSTAGMYHRWERLISFISRDETLHPGEVIGSGTVGGGTLFEHDLALQSGDTIEFEITGLGVLRNRVIRSSSPVVGG
jgi:2-keto-4-pentenoate hydratase/2-oxohepta-3-ene-1,7-dioic acid hydratase in catechol pathway